VVIATVAKGGNQGNYDGKKGGKGVDQKGGYRYDGYGGKNVCVTNCLGNSSKNITIPSLSVKATITFFKREDPSP
jgi:hypothetical protein